MKINQSFAVNFNYNIHFSHNIFGLNNHLLGRELEKFGKGNKCGFLIDSGVIEKWPTLIDQIKTYINKNSQLNMALEPLIITGGEAAKSNMNEVNNILNYISSGKFDRHSVLIGIGGGAVLDVVGFACAIGHRGMKHIRIPTTVLAQNDSGVGVKNGINFLDKKNFIGTFSPPELVINDSLFLTTLTTRDWRAGISEAIKVSLIKNKPFFEWIESNSELLKHRDLDTMKDLIYTCALLHAQHISKNGDPFEKQSSRPLDFGHWAAHKLEQLTDYNLKHGEAVSIGIALDTAYCVVTQKLNETVFQRIMNLLQGLEFEININELFDDNKTNINPNLLNGIEEFQEHLGGELSIPLISDIGIQIETNNINLEKLNEASQLMVRHVKHYANQ